MVRDTHSPWGGRPTRAGGRLPAGFTLVEMALVLAIIGLMAALFLPLSSGMREAQQIKETRAKLAAIEAALIRFVMLNNRLPCPANGALPDSDANAGLEQRASTNHGCAAVVETQAVVPWRTLGLTVPDALDAWGTHISYRPWMTTAAPQRSLTLDGSLAGCAGSLPFSARTASDWNSCLQSGSPPLGHRVLPSVGSSAALAQPTPPAGTMNTGAAYVLISHGPNRFGGYTPQGVLISGGAPGDERQNDNGLPVKTNASGQGYIQGQAGTNFDDLLAWRTIMQVAVEAKKVN